ncbi:response regulator, partial [Candidatus Woesearchaeota archaeon]
KEYNLIKAENGEEGLKLLRKEKVDLIILDIMLPKMSGIEFLDKVRKYKKYDQVKILIFTIIRFTAKEEKDLLKRGAQGILNKPLPIKDLQRNIKAALKG